MKLPINIIARFVLKRIVVPAVAKAAAQGKLDGKTVKHAVGDAVQDELLRRAAKSV